MNLARRAPLLGLVLLLAAFGYAAWQVFSRSSLTDASTGSAPRVIRFAHWQLEAGVRDALDALARDYEALHPGVRVEQIAIPERIYPNWATTQLVGGTAPDLVQLGKGIDPPRIARHFTPLGELLEQPNPYNAGTPLAARPWRETFVDNVEGGYYADLSDHYGVSIFTGAVRVFYNRELLRAVTGSSTPPATFAELLALGEKTRDFAARTGRRLSAFAGSRDNVVPLLDELLGTQLQRLATELNPLLPFPLPHEGLYLAHARQRWSFQDPALRSAAATLRDFGQSLPPGFLQLSRDDAMLQFVQGRALMIATGSWDATGLRRQSDFEIGVFRLPMPAPSDPRFAPFTINRPVDTVLRSYGGFGLFRASRHPELALDFLRFLTSRASNEKFSALSGWLPLIVGVEPPEFMRDFLPDRGGYPNGPMLRWGADTARLYENSLHQLFAPDGGPEAFLSTLERELPAAMRADLSRARRAREQSIRRADLLVSAYQKNPYDNSTRLSALLETQIELETAAALSP